MEIWKLLSCLCGGLHRKEEVEEEGEEGEENNPQGSNVGTDSCRDKKLKMALLPLEFLLFFTHKRLGEIRVFRTTKKREERSLPLSKRSRRGGFCSLFHSKDRERETEREGGEMDGEGRTGKWRKGSRKGNSVVWIHSVKGRIKDVRDTLSNLWGKISPFHSLPPHKHIFKWIITNYGLKFNYFFISIRFD